MGSSKIIQQALIKSKESLQKALSSSIFWYFSLFCLLVPFNTSLIRMLEYFFYVDVPNIVVSTIELINVSISGWAIFTIFIRLETEGIIPSEVIRKSKEEQKRLLIALFFVPSSRISVYLISLILVGENLYRVSNVEINIHIALPIIIILSIYLWMKLNKQTQKLSRKNKLSISSDPIIYSLQTHQALNKFVNRLTEEEQNELSLLTLYSEKNKNLTLVSIVKVCWNGLVLAWFFEILVELIQRL